MSRLYYNHMVTLANDRAVLTAHALSLCHELSNAFNSSSYSSFVCRGWRVFVEDCYCLEQIWSVIALSVTVK